MFYLKLKKDSSIVCTPKKQFDAPVHIYINYSERFSWPFVEAKALIVRLKLFLARVDFTAQVCQTFLFSPIVNFSLGFLSRT